jgi:signal transduction histidine kinase
MKKSSRLKSGNEAAACFDPSDSAAHGAAANEPDYRALYTELAQLVGGLAHEIRNPLSTMRLNLDLLAEEFERMESPQERRMLHKIDRVRNESHRLERILEDFLRFARVRELQLTPADLNVVVERVRDFIEPQAMSQNVIVRTDYGAGVEAVPLDAELFQQALLNLVLNALHAMPEGGELILTTRLDKNGTSRRALLEVVDTGQGIPAELQERVFDPFFSTRQGGSGLGLPTTRKIIEAHGGTIGLESVPRRGTKFTIRLPV